ncbi:Carbon monoxide dehydrogenase subunit G [metagenome]|uniref:Carbon monoxide dehydrogenase subunit G n=1 Tax=metagenome TaxID=256318 RepID=A0A2P2CFX9_9ZZZZ
MRITGEHTLPFGVHQVWDSLLDPAVLVRTIPGCERLETTGENAYDMTVTAGVAAIKGTYSGTCELSDLQPQESLHLRVRGAGAPGTIDASVAVALTAMADGSTTVSYQADAVVGGMIGGVGQRMLTSVSRRMAGEFFTNVGAALSQGTVAGPATTGGPASAVETGRGTVFTTPVAVRSQVDFLKGVALGAGLVLLGVLAGSLRGRRR